MPPLLKIILRRVALGILTLLLVSILVFAATQALPGDTARAILGRYATPERLKELRERLGLDRPATTQYVTWLGDIVRGDLGRFAGRSGAGHGAPRQPGHELRRPGAGGGPHQHPDLYPARAA